MALFDWCIWILPLIGKSKFQLKEQMLYILGTENCSCVEGKLAGPLGNRRLRINVLQLLA